MQIEKLAIIGIGSELRRDDAIGIIIIRKLKDEVINDKVAILEGGTTPENLSGVLRKFQPSHILLVDAAEVGQAPGEFAMVDPKDIKGMGLSTHSFSLATIADYFKEITGAEVLFLGIQPKEITFGEGMSPELQRAVGPVIQKVREFLP